MQHSEQFKKGILSYIQKQILASDTIFLNSPYISSSLRNAAVRLVLMRMLMLVMMVMLLMIPRATLRANIARNKLVQEIRAVTLPVGRDEPDLDTLRTTHLGADARADEVLNTVRLLDGPRGGHGQLELEQVVGARLETTHVLDLDGVGIRALRVHTRVGQGLRGSAADGGFDLVVDGDVDKLAESLEQVLVASLDDHAGDDERADGVEPGGVGGEVGGHDDGGGEDGRERVDAVVHGVAEEDAGLPFAGDLARCTWVSIARPIDSRLAVDRTLGE